MTGTLSLRVKLFQKEYPEKVNLKKLKKLREAMLLQGLIQWSSVMTIVIVPKLRETKLVIRSSRQLNKGQ
jgi:hypothetical protein